MGNFKRIHAIDSCYEDRGTKDILPNWPGVQHLAFGSRDQHTIGGQSIVCTLIRIIDKGSMLDHNIVKSYVRQELMYGLRTVQPFRIGAIPQHPSGFGYDQFPYAYHVVYQLTFPTDHDIIGGFMPGLGTKMAQGYVTVDEIEQEAPASGEDARHLCQHPTVVHGINEKAKRLRHEEYDVKTSRGERHGPGIPMTEGHVDTCGGGFPTSTVEQ